MKLNKLWKTLTRDQRQTWKTWAKNNPVLLDDGVLHRVSGEKAFTVVLNQRAGAGEAANASVVPASVTWLGAVFSTYDAGPFTKNAGYVGFRVEQPVLEATKWFVWATRPLLAIESQPLPWLRFVKCMSLGAMNTDDVVPSLANDYRAVLGSFNGPGADGAWPEDHFVWFRLHQYANGQLGPARVLKGQVQVEL